MPLNCRSKRASVQFTAPSRELKVANRHLEIVEHINYDGDPRIRMDSGHEVHFKVREPSTLPVIQKTGLCGNYDEHAGE
jgi:hypothetical protein